MAKEEQEKTHEHKATCSVDNPEDCEPCRIAVGGVYATQICREFKETKIDCDVALKQMQEGIVSPLTFIDSLKTEAKRD